MAANNLTLLQKLDIPVGVVQGREFFLSIHVVPSSITATVLSTFISALASPFRGPNTPKTLGRHLLLTLGRNVIARLSTQQLQYHSTHTPLEVSQLTHLQIPSRHHRIQLPRLDAITQSKTTDHRSPRLIHKSLLARQPQSREYRAILPRRRLGDARQRRTLSIRHLADGGGGKGGKRNCGPLPPV